MAGDAFDALAEARRLLRTARAGSLATLDADGDPFASLAGVATAPDGAPLLLVSQLAAHTRHMAADARVSLLLAEAGAGDPLAHPRLTLTGRAARLSHATTTTGRNGFRLRRSPGRVRRSSRPPNRYVRVSTPASSSRPSRPVSCRINALTGRPSRIWAIVRRSKKSSAPPRGAPAITWATRPRYSLDDADIILLLSAMTDGASSQSVPRSGTNTFFSFRISVAAFRTCATSNPAIGA